MKKLLVLLTGLMLVSSLGMAQADPDPDSMGIYFDTDATITTATTATPFAQVFAYLVVANPTSSGISGWEGKVTVSPGPAAPVWGLAAGTDYNDDVELFTVGIGIGAAALRPINNVIVLATWSGYILAPTDEVLFTIYPFPGSVTFSDTPGYVDGDDAGIIVPCGVSTGYPYGAACASINSAYVPIPNEDVTWGTVKALYQ